jgi:hypothetical protein
MTELMGNARSDDTNLVKYGIEGWIPLDPVQNPLRPSIAGFSKEVRGWYHPETAKALTPLSRLQEFEANPM